MIWLFKHVKSIHIKTPGSKCCTYKEKDDGATRDRICLEGNSIYHCISLGKCNKKAGTGFLGSHFFSDYG